MADSKSANQQMAEAALLTAMSNSLKPIAIR